MSGGALSLEKSVRTCNVNVGEASRIQSDRFENPSNMVCVVWNGLDLVGREVSPDSFYTKTAGCNSAEDRVMVENAQRPQYMSYITLNAGGIEGDMYGNNVSAKRNSQAATQFDQNRNKLTGQYGNQWRSSVDYTSCSVGAYERAMSEVNGMGRNQAAMQSRGQAQYYAQAARM